MKTKIETEEVVDERDKNNNKYLFLYPYCQKELKEQILFITGLFPRRWESKSSAELLPFL